MSSTPATFSDLIPMSLPEEITHLDHEITPAMEPLVSLLRSLAKNAPSAMRNKHKLYSIIIRAREICNHLLAIGSGPEPVTLETLDEYYNSIDSLEEYLLRVAGFLVADRGSFSPELCASWSETRAGLVAIMYGLFKFPFTVVPSRLEGELVNNGFFDDCYWLSFLLHEGIEKEIDLRFLNQTPPKAVAAVKEGLVYLEREIRFGHLPAKTRECVMDIATCLHKHLSALPSREQHDAAPSVRQAEPIPVDQDPFIKELSAAFSVLDLESSLQPLGARKLEGKWLAITAVAPHRQLQQLPEALSSSVIPKVEPDRDSTIKARMTALNKPQYSQIDALLNAIERNKAEIEAQEFSMQANRPPSSSPIIPAPSTSTTSTSATSSPSRLPQLQSHPLLQQQMTIGGLASISGLSPTSTSQATLGSPMYRKRLSDLDLTELGASTSSKRMKLESGRSSPVQYALSQKTNLVKSEQIEPSDRSTPPQRSSISSNPAPAPHRQLQQLYTAPSSSVMPKVEPGRDSTIKARMTALKKPPYSQIDALLDAIERNKAEIEAQELIGYSTMSRTAHGSTSFTTRLPPMQVDSPPPIKLESANAAHSTLHPTPHHYQIPNQYTWGESNVASLQQQLEDALDSHGSPTRVQSLMAGIQHWDNGSSYPSLVDGSSQAVKSEPIAAIKWPAPRGSVYATPAVTKGDQYPSYGVAGPTGLAPPPAFTQLEDVKPKVDPYAVVDTYEPPAEQSFDFLDESDDDDGGPVPNQLNYGAPAYSGSYGYGSYTRSGEALTDFLVSAGNAEIFEKDVTVHNSLQYLGLRDLSQNFHGMKIPLMAHQVLGVAWMAKKEVDPKKSGGIMADEMGLGKTVQTIATVCFNSPKPNRPKGNLIVAPVALLDQWRSEIESKTNRNFQILIYHGSSKPKGQDAAKVLAQYDFVLTSYGTLSAEWPENDDFKARQEKKRKNAKKDDFIVVDSGDEGSAKKEGKAKDVKMHSPLFETVWHRIVLDEAQNIRNRHTRISVAVTDLHATHRWCLTDTPLTNGTADAFGLLRFLAIRPWYEWKEFNQHVVLREKKNADLATERLQLIFRECLIRRKKDSTLDGRKLIELPPKDYHNPEYQFSEEELEIYNFLQARSRAIFNKFLRQGTVLRNYSQVLVLLLRLRQCCVHPALIAQYEDAFLQKGEARESGGDDENIINELMRAEDIKGAEWVVEVKRKFLVDALERMEAEKREGGDAIANQECPICFEPMTDGFVIPCKHVYCRGCINNLFETPGQLQDGMNAVNENQRPCPQCRKPFVKEHAFLQRAFMPTDSELGLDIDDGEDTAKRSKGKGKAKARASRSFQTPSDDGHSLHHSDGDEGYVSPSQRAIKEAPRRSGRATKNFKYEAESDDSMDDFIVEDGETEAAKDASDAKLKQKAARKGKAKMRVDSDDEYGGSQAEEDDDDEIVEIKKGDYLTKVGIAEPVRQPPMMAKFLPSTKMIAMMGLLENIRAQNPNDKVVVVSQWTSALELCANYLDEKQFSYVRYEGSMNRTAREHAVRAFMDTTPDNVRVMLMPLKAGGAGLNLVRANWVISLDIAWSEAVEAQAFDRTHRLGQTKPVQIHRLCIANTVEGRIKALQAKKKHLADGSLGEGGANPGRLSVKELANLFGLDMRGNIID